MKRLSLFFVLLFIMGVQILQAQTKTVSGTVNLKGETMGIPGVSVIIKGTTIGTISDINGKYSIQIDDNKKFLIFSFVGMKKQEVDVSNLSNLDIILESDFIGLNEVVAVGYGTMKKSDLTGSSSRLSSESITSTQLPNVSQALQGKMSGVRVQTNSGAPGGDVKIRIRGTNSINGSNDPLIIVDGFVGQSLSDINPSDIASIEVLKDASSTAIYGSRGANGVILVTTKTGKKGKLKVKYNSYIAVQSISKKLDLLNASDFANTINSKRLAFGKKAPYSDSDIALYTKNGGTDWQDQVYRTAYTHNHDISISGSSDKVNYLFSASYLNQEGILKSSNYEKFNYRANINVEINDKFKIGFIINGNLNKDRPHKLSWANGSISNDAISMEPTLDIYNADGSYTSSISPVISNPVADYREQNHYIETNKQNINSYLDYKINKHWNLRLSGGFTTTDYLSNMYSSEHVYSGQGDQGRVNISNKKHFTWQNTNILTYKNTIGDHRLNFTFVNEQTAYNLESSMLGAKRFDINRGYYDASLGREPLAPKSKFIDWQLMSFLSRFNYAFQDKYLATLSVRADGSSKFSDGNKWDYFPSASLAWRMSEEDFIKNIDFVNNLKLRASYGVTGSQATAPYQSKGIMNTGVNYPIDGRSVSVGISSLRTDNPLLSWEKTSQFDLGLDLSLFKGKLTFSADYYQKTTNDLLMRVAIPYYSGFASEFKNIGEVSNKGLELDLGTHLSVGEFDIVSDVNFGFNKNKVVDLGGPDRVVLGNGRYLLQKGESMGLIYGYKFLGVWQEDEAAEAAKMKNKPGDAHFLDVNGDNKISADDREIIGHAYPDFNMGWSTSIKYKNFDLNMMFVGVFGNEIMNEVYARSMGWLISDPVSSDIKNRWTTENKSNTIPAFSKTYKSKFMGASSAVVEDGSYIRLSNLSLGYTFNNNVLNRLKIQKLRLYVSGQNLFVLSGYKGYNPDVNNPGGAGTDYSVGFDIAPYPSARVINFGLNLSF